MEGTRGGVATGGAGRAVRPEETDPAVDVIVPLKQLARAKSRLVAATAGTDPQAHRALVLALARDTLAAVRRTPQVGRVVLVTAEDALDLGIDVERVEDPGGGLNAALRRGATFLLDAPRAAGPPRAIAVLQADLPALRSAELSAALRAALAGVADHPAAFVPDHHGSGTTMLVTAPGRRPRPLFGPGSADAHRDAGAVALAGRWPGLRADVDTPDDLRRVRRLGCGPATTAWAAGPATGPVSAGRIGDERLPRGDEAGREEVAAHRAPRPESEP